MKLIKVPYSLFAHIPPRPNEKKFDLFICRDCDFATYTLMRDRYGEKVVG